MTLDRPPHAPSRVRGFTIVELLIVVAIIALLAGIVLGGLSAVRKRAGGTTTLATMQAFQNAAEAFRQDHGYYPGLVPERLLANDPQISGTQNALLHLLGGYVVEGEVAQDEYDLFTGPAVLEYEFAPPPGLGGTAFRFKVDLARLGDGPRIDGTSYQPYLTLRDRDLGPASRNGSVVDGRTLPDVLDAWGTPIIYLRRASDVGALLGQPDEAEPVQFLPQTMAPYLDAPALGALGRNQVLGGDSGNVEGSILTGILDDPFDGDAAGNLVRIVEHPGIDGRARGAFMLLSAGPDGVFFSAVDGPGNRAAPISFIGLQPRSVVDDYDDVILFGGS